MAAFSKGEKILCFHGPLLYEAKILKVNKPDVSTDVVQFYVHYKGWKQKWDEWVPESRIVRLDERGIQQQHELRKLHAEQKGVTRRMSVDVSGPEDSGVENPIDTETFEDNNAISHGNDKEQPLSEARKQKSLIFRFPDVFRKKLIYEWDRIAREQKLHLLPSQLTVSQILDRVRDTRPTDG